jgi:hypothetical protein
MKTKNPLFVNGLASFDEALDCTAPNNRLKRRRGDRTGRIQAFAGIGPQYQNQDHFLDAKRGAVRVTKMLCHRAGIRAGNCESRELGKQ